MSSTNTDQGSEPINFRAALAAFEQNASAPTTFHSPKPRPPHATRQPPPQTPARPSSGIDPVPRSSSTPRIRNNSDTLMPPFSNHPFASTSSSATVGVPATSASGMLSAPSPTFAVSPTFPRPLRKSGSGLSLNELAASLPRSSPAGAGTASPLLRSRSRSVVEQEHGSAPNSGRSSPYPPSRGSQFVPEGDATRADSPAQHMLDTSADDEMSAHAVMESAPASPRVPPQVPDRKGSASSGHSASTPRLPPRPGAAGLAPSPTIGEFGQLPNAGMGRAKTGVGYATYTPAKRGERGDGTMTPPALPPRSATVGGKETPHKTRVGAAPVVPKKPPTAGKPPPPPRPAKTTLDGAAGGFKLGATSQGEPQPPPPRQRTMVAGAQHQRSLTGSSGSLNTVTHRKTGSNVFTSISLSDDASGELKRSLESDLHADHLSKPPPARGRAGPVSVRSPTGAAAAAGGGAGGMVSSLIGAASALPLFKPTTGGGGRLADGAPSKQPYYAVSRSASAHSIGGEGMLWSGGAVKLADDGVKKVLLKEPRDGEARRRYEVLFDGLVAKQESIGGMGSNASTIREAQGERKTSGVQALKGWFESDSAPATNPPPAPATPSSPAAEGVDPTLPAKTIRNIWTRSHLPPSFLAQVWDQAVTPTRGVEKENFVRAMAGIDAELERRKQRREARRVRASSRRAAGAAGRRVPPPPPAAAAAAVV